MYTIYNNENILVAQSTLEMDQTIKDLIQENDYQIRGEYIPPTRKIKVTTLMSDPINF